MVPHNSPRIYVLDTNVLMHDPTAIFRFAEHNIFLPMVVLEELDRGKKGMSEVARNVRQVSRFLDELMSSATTDEISSGLSLPCVKHGNEEKEQQCGHVFFQTEALDNKLPASLPGHTADNDILSTALALQDKHKDSEVILVSKDINLRIKAAVVGLPAEDYQNDKALDDLSLLYKGETELPEDFWDTHSKNMESWREDGHTFYRVEGPDTESWYPNQFLYTDDDSGFEATVVTKEDGDAMIELVDDYRVSKRSVWGINARNRQQNFALNLLMNPEVDFVSLLGTAGTGKTLLALAAGLTQVLDHNIYKEIIMSRVTVPVGEDIGFLPGTEEEKMTPWMGALMDNLEVLAPADGQDEWGQAATKDILARWIKIRSLNFMRGRTFLNKFIIIDEAQNLTPKQMKTLITRAGPGTKVVCLGNVAQIDTPYLTETSSGITYVVDHFKNWEHSGHITLTIGERSRLADYASEIL